MAKVFEQPFYIKAVIFLIGITALMAILFIAKSIIVPIIFAVIIAILLHPLVNFFARFRINRILSIIFALLLTFIVLGGFVSLIFSQASSFGDSWPMLVDKFTEVLDQSITWASGYFDINPTKIKGWVASTKSEIIDISSSSIKQTLTTIGGGLVIMFLVPVYVFLILFYHPLLLEFIHRLFAKYNLKEVSEVVTQIKTVIQRYLIGLVIEAAIITVMYSVALFALGVDYAILLGIIGAVLNMIPYIGGIVGVALPMIVALATLPSGFTALYILIIYYIIQLIDNNYIVPKIVASQVKINALFSIIVVIAGNALWGIPGMFLSLPLLAIIKLIFDHIESLKPWGFLLGDTMPPLPILKIKPMFKKKAKSQK
ncbi:MAG: AI-2E family transporter [Bacteroidetes bacterium HGW-Bacteroidetes-21]|jgi:predicted PurR-regulated permease PerM|nr:MAG: AI-2E family transporter [Bacteroidetes bacterium HGW-Bacteroidetes-21]